MVQQAIQDGVGDGGFTDDGMPVFDWALAGDDSGSLVVAVLDDFEQIIRVLARDISASYCSLNTRLVYRQRSTL